MKLFKLWLEINFWVITLRGWIFFLSFITVLFYAPSLVSILICLLSIPGSIKLVKGIVNRKFAHLLIDSTGWFLSPLLRVFVISPPPDAEPLGALGAVPPAIVLPALFPPVVYFFPLLVGEELTGLEVWADFLVLLIVTFMLGVAELAFLALHLLVRGELLLLQGLRHRVDRRAFFRLGPGAFPDLAAGLLTQTVLASVLDHHLRIAARADLEVLGRRCRLRWQRGQRCHWRSVLLHDHLLYWLPLRLVHLERVLARFAWVQQRKCQLVIRLW